MKIRRFIASDMREAMRQVREALGPDAVILDTQRVAGGIELSAAVDHEFAAAIPLPSDTPVRQAEAAPAALRTEIPQYDAAIPDTPPPPATMTAAATGPGFDELQSELRTLRELLETQLSRLAWNDGVRRNAAATTAMRNLARMGFAPEVVGDIIAAVGDGLNAHTAWSAPLRQLEASIPVCEEELMSDGGVFAIVGPTGVGKTTTIAKLAARHALRGRPEDVALVTTDTFRIGAREQLETFGEILGSPVYQAGDGTRLAEILNMLADRRLVLIDTAGMGQRDVCLARQLSWLAGADSRIKVLLALPANTQAQALQQIVDAFMVARPSACILTKTDEASSLGGALSALLRSRLPLAYVANGQRVPEDLHCAGPRRTWLVKSALELMGQHAGIDEDFMAEHFAGVDLHACA